MGELILFNLKVKKGLQRFLLSIMVHLRIYSWCKPNNRSSIHLIKNKANSITEHVRGRKKKQNGAFKGRHQLFYRRLQQASSQLNSSLPKKKKKKCIEGSKPMQGANYVPLLSANYLDGHFK